MFGPSQKFLLYIAHLWGVFCKFLNNWKSGVITFIFSFILVFSCLYVTAQRGVAVKKIRAGLPVVISSLNELGIDLAYDKIKFNPVAFFPLMTMEHPQIYSLTENNYWNVSFGKLRAYSDILGSPKMQLIFSSQGQITFLNSLHDFIAKKTFIEIRNGASQKGFSLQTSSLNIKDFALIKEASFTLSSVKNDINIAKNSASYKSLLNVDSVTINGMVNYPLSSFINRIHAESNVIGKFTYNDDLLTSVESWVKDGGFIDIPRLIVQWAPLNLVGRGRVTLQENLQPEITFNTASTGMLKLIKSLQDISFITNSNVYVANILLSNKAFKLTPEDKELTITTPINYSDGRISIENLVIKDFNKEVQ